jgi:ion channel-forming bestrophin family protein
MVQYNPKEWFGLIFTFHKSDTFRQLFWVMVSVALYSFALAYLEIEVLSLNFKSTPALHSILGFVLSILLVFRTNTAYDRWWEGRRNWGALTNYSRSLAIKLTSIIPKTHADYKWMMDMIGLYPKVLAAHLRNQKLQNPSLPLEVHQPNFVYHQLFQKLQQLRQAGVISEMQLLQLNTELLAYPEVCGACERIKNTPIPYSYSMFLKKFIFIYIITMPYGFIKEFEYGIVLVVTFVLYVLGSLELVAEEIENPFGTDANDLNLDEMAQNIELNVKEIANTF